MKKILIAILAAALVSTAWAGEKDADYARFEKWLRAVQEAAPRHDLKLDGDEAEKEFFWLYCWQSDDRSIVRAIRMAKKVWRSEKVPWRERIVKNDNTYDQWLDWYNALPREARRHPGADKAYWKQWYQRGFSPAFAWKNTDPKQEHTFPRPLLRGEKSE